MSLITREKVIRGGLRQLPHLLAECTVPRCGEGCDGTRTEPQVSAHDEMCHYLSKSIESGNPTGVRLGARDRRWGQSSAIAMFAYAHALGFAGSVSQIWVRDRATGKDIMEDIKAYVARKAVLFRGLECVEDETGLAVCMSMWIRSSIMVTVSDPLPPMDELMPTIDMHIVDYEREALILFSGTPLVHSPIQLPSEKEAGVQ